MNYSLPGFSVHGILQATMLERVAIPFSRGYFWVRDQNWVSHTAGRFFTNWTTREALYLYKFTEVIHHSVRQTSTHPYFCLCSCLSTSQKCHLSDPWRHLSLIPEKCSIEISFLKWTIRWKFLGNQGKFCKGSICFHTQRKLWSIHQNLISSMKKEKKEKRQDWWSGSYLTIVHLQTREIKNNKK